MVEFSEYYLTNNVSSFVVLYLDDFLSGSLTNCDNGLKRKILLENQILYRDISEHVETEGGKARTIGPTLNMSWRIYSHSSVLTNRGKINKVS